MTRESVDALSGYRVEKQQGSSGMSKWLVEAPEGGPTFVVKLLGATVAKMEEMHHRKLTPSDLRIGIARAVTRARHDLDPAASAGGSQEVDVMVRDSDLAELDGRIVGPTNDVPY